MARGKKKQKLSLREFRAWLQGVEELQSEDWHPNLEQWKLIRGKIDGIVEQQNETTVVGTNEHKVIQPHPENPIYRQPAPSVPSSIPNGPIVEMSPEAKKLLTQSNTIESNVEVSDETITSPSPFI